MQHTGPTIERPSGRVVRFVAVTAVATPANLLLYAFLLRSSGYPAVVSNLVAASVITPLTFLANRQWVWRVGGEVSVSAEVVPYWVSTCLNVLAASGAVALLERSGVSRTVLTVVPLAIYTLIWGLRFAYLDRVLFAPAEPER